MSDTEVDLGAAALLVPTKKPRQPMTFREAKRRAKDLAREVHALAPLKPGEQLRQCKAVIKRTGLRCKKFSIRGGVVCMTHGGGAPQVRKKADKRLLAMVEPALLELEALVHQDEHLPTKLGAIRTVLERAGAAAIGPLKTDSGDKDMRPVINIGIIAGGVPAPVVTVSKLLPAAPKELTGEVIADDEDEDAQQDS